MTAKSGLLIGQRVEVWLYLSFLQIISLRSEVCFEKSMYANLTVTEKDLTAHSVRIFTLQYPNYKNNYPLILNIQHILKENVFSCWFKGILATL